MDKATAIDVASTDDSYVSRLLGRLLRDRIRQGTLTIELPNNTDFQLRGPQTGRSAHLKIRRWRALRRVLLRGGVGFAEGYLDSDWDSDSISELLNFIADNLKGVSGIANGLGMQRLIDSISHGRNHNSRSGSQRNISFHYDLGNDFYRAWLDDTMSYSAGIFDHTNDLETSQHDKYQRLCQVAEVSSNHKVLEIGCGWGGLLDHLASIGCDATGISVSGEQIKFANQRLQGADNVTARFQDYRDIEGRFDRVLSIEMFEAVGERYWDTFAGKLAGLLTDDGIAAMQIITIDEAAFDNYQRRPDFIQQHVFPGGMLPTVTHINRVLERQGLRVTDLLRFGQDYAETLRHWRERFIAAWPVIRTRGFDDQFYRLWMYYLGYCEAGFNIGRTDVVQIRIERC